MYFAFVLHVRFREREKCDKAQNQIDLFVY